MSQPLDSALDAGAVALWDDSYQLSAAPTLWGEDPVPATQQAARIFADNDCRYLWELPCGDGRNTKALASSAVHVVAADASPRALRIAATAARSHRIRNVAFVIDDVLNPTGPDGSIEGIFCWDLLGHIVAVERALANLIQRLVPGGVLIGNFFALEDSARGPNMKTIGHEEYVFDDRFYFRFCDERVATDLLDRPEAELLRMSLEQWEDPPHEGFREYIHTHASWMFVLRRR